ncbi:hypothetical protein ACFSZS_12230 [Seohaeicola zhoushanensis]
MDMLEDLLPVGSRDAVASYKVALSMFSNVVTDTDEVLKMRPFWEGAAQVLVARDVLIRSLG